MSWEDIEVTCGFGGGEETTRFGPRQETGSSLYQVDTVACVANKKQCEGTPWLLSNACTQRMGLVIEESLLVFDESCSEHQCTFSAESRIDAVGWSNDGNFLVYADRAGCISLAHLDSQQVLFSKHLVPQHKSTKNPWFISVKFLEEQEEGLSELLIIGTDGQVFRFTDIDLTALKQAISDRDVEKATQIQGAIKMSTFDVKDCHNVVMCASFFMDGDEKSALVAGCGDFGMSEWKIPNDNDAFVTDFCQHLSPDVGFQKVLETPDGQYIVALDTSNQISLWSRQSFIFLECWSEANVENFILFLTSSVETDSQSKNSQSREELKIVLLTTPSADKKRELIVLSLPDFEHVYTLKVSACAVLAMLPSQQETIMFVEGVEEENLDDSMEGYENRDFNVATVRIRCLMEAIPQNRFSRLLHKKKFDEAEEFAKAFNLDVQLVHKVKSHYILDQLSPWGTDPHVDTGVYEELMLKLKSCLDKIEDKEHLVNCCLQAQLPTLNATYDLLNYAREKVNFESREFTKSSSLFQDLLDGINRLVTFEVAFGVNKFSGSAWGEFLKSSLIDEVIKCFIDANITSGIIIWRRHSSEFKFTYPKLEQILHSISPSTPSCKIIPWLREDFVPFVLTMLPEGQSILADWLENTARGLESTEKENWPDNALDLAEVMYTAFSNVSQSTEERGEATPMQFATKICKLSIPYFDHAGDATNADMSVIGLSSSMKKLGDLVKSLREVKSLHHEYNCKLSLDQFCSEDTRTIAFRLLNRIAAAELIPQTIKKYVKPYVIANNMKLDQLLYEYIVEFVGLNNQVASLWEPKVIAIINEITKKEPRCDATLKLMLKAKTPWSREVEELVSIQMKDNPGNEKLQRQYQFASLRKMMAGYGIRDTNLADMSRIKAVIKYMFSTDNPDSLKDALQICKHFPAVTAAYVYFVRIKFWISTNKIEESCDLLRSIPLADAMKLSEYALMGADNMSWKPLDEEDMVEQMQMTEAVIMILTTVSRLDQNFKNKFGNTLSNLKSIHGLQVEFGLFLSLTEYNNEEYRLQLVKNYVKNPKEVLTKVLPSVLKKSKERISSVLRLIRFSELLGVKGVDLDSLLLDVYNETGETEKLHHTTDKVTKLDENEYMHTTYKHTKLLSKVIDLLMNGNDTTHWVKTADSTHSFVSHALSHCTEDLLSDYLFTNKMLRIISFISSQCESTDFQDDPKRIDGLIHQWIEDQYTDDSLVLSSQDVLPLLQRLLMLSVSEPLESVIKYESGRLSGRGVSCSVSTNDDGNHSVSVSTLEFSKVAQALVNLLQENNQQELAMQIIMLGISMCAQHTANLQMGIPIDVEEDQQIEVDEAKLMEHEFKSAQLVLGKGEGVVKEYCSNLVNSILSHRVVDHHLALCYLDVFPSKQGNQLLYQLKNKFSNKFTRIQLIAKVGVDFASLRSDTNFRNTCQALKDCAFWGRKLQLLRIPPPWNIYSVNSDTVERRRILEILVQHKDIDIQSIMMYCKSFSCDEEEAILMYIECQLLPSEHFSLTTKTAYQEKIDECISMYMSRMQTYTNLEKLLNSSVNKISPYDYERLTYVFKKIADISDHDDSKACSEENVRLLEMLSLYKRTATEIDYNVECSLMGNDLDEEQLLHGKSSVIPEVVRQRLPFHPLAKKGVSWQVLNPELTSEKNVVLLKPIVNKLKFDTDQMCAKAVQNITHRELANANKQGSIVTFEFSLVKNILDMIKNHMMMMAAAKWLARYLPRGAEKAKVLKSIVDRAEVLVSCTSGNAKEEAINTYKRFNDVYKRVSIEAALIEHGINDEKFFAMCNEPSKLITELYEQYGDKVKFETGKFTGAPEVHLISKTIASITNDIDLERVHVYLMNKWLPYIRVSSANDDSDDVDMVSTVSSKETVKKENERNLRRVMYVLASSFNHKTIRSLLHAVYQDAEGQSMSNVCRIRALQVLFTLIDTQSIEKESKLTIASIHEKLLSCIYLSELEALHISHSEEAFNKCNKEGLVKGLWRNHSHEPQGVRLIADICLDYKIFDPKLWNSLLLKLLSFGMISYVTHVLVLLSGIPQLREIPSLTKMWRAVVTAPFTSVSCPLSAEEEEACLKAAQLLSRCPVILDIGLPEIASLMKKAGLYIQCLICMKLIPDRTVRKNSIQALFDDIGIDAILAKVKKSRDQGMVDIHLQQIEEEVFDYVNEHNLFVSLYGTAYFDSLVGYLVRSLKLNNLLSKTIVAGRLNNALDLVQLYISVHPKSATAQTVLGGNMEKRHALLVYLQNEGLLSDTKQYLASFLNPDTSSSNDTNVSPIEFNSSNEMFQYLNGN